MRFILMAAAIAASSLPTTAIAMQSAPMVVAAPTPGGLVLPAGTTVRVRTLAPLHSNDNKTGQQFDLEIAEDVMLNGRVVIARGSPGTGELTLVKKKGMWGKSGKLEGRFISVRSNGRDIPIRGTLNDKGTTGTAGVVGAIVVLPIAGFFVTGTSAEIAAGSSFSAKTDSDIPIAFAN